MTGGATPLIVVGVPVWQGAGFVKETLTSVLAQQRVTLNVVISVDGADDASAAACAPFLNDARVRLVVQPSRLGWVRNSAAVLAAAVSQGADYACIQPKDDLMEAHYLSSLLAVAQATPQAALIYSDILAFGDQQFSMGQWPVMGSPVARLVSLLMDHYPAVAFRGLTPVSALRAVEPMSGNPFEDFAADTVWITRLATVGGLARVPYLLYRKRYHSANTHMKWNLWPRDRQVAAWSRHCLDMLAEALKVTEDPAAMTMLVSAARVRLLQSGGAPMIFHPTMTSLSADERAAVLSEFDAAAAKMLARK
jgi:GT2 family glycosyltransferase